MPSAQAPQSLLNQLREHPDDSEAWQRFDACYRPLLHTWLRQYGLQSQDADDLVQQVLAVVIVSSFAVVLEGMVDCIHAPGTDRRTGPGSVPRSSAGLAGNGVALGEQYRRCQANPAPCNVHYWKNP
jgi:hypothetical protein